MPCRDSARRASARQKAPRQLSLVELQRWFQNEIFRPHQLPRKRRPKSTPGAAQVVLPSHTLTASERVAIYQNMYFARANECLAQDFPAVLRIIGYEAFRRLVRAYLTRHPSQHYSLTEHVLLEDKDSIKVVRWRRDKYRA